MHSAIPARQALAYLDEVCRRLDQNPRRVLRFARWCQSQSVRAFATGVALIAPGCGGTVEASSEPAITSLAEICVDNLDNDHDGRIDCGDPDCRGSLNCRVELRCKDELDNDGDGKTDCDDLDCLSACQSAGPAYGAPPGLEWGCGDGVDYDGDKLIDCSDGQCAGDERCTGYEPESSCGDGVDSNHDGLVDCDDPSCSNRAFCSHE